MKRGQSAGSVSCVLPWKITGHHDNPYSSPPQLELGHRLPEMGCEVQGLNLCSVRSSRKLENAHTTVGLLKRVKALRCDAHGCADKCSCCATMSNQYNSLSRMMP